MSDDLLTTNEAAQYLGIQPQSLRLAKRRGTGPTPSVDRGRGYQVLYSRKALDEYRARRKR